MTFDEYQTAACRTWKPDRIQNHVLGLCGETGEIAEKVKKLIYHSKAYETADMKGELGDVLWYLTALCTDHGLALEDVAIANDAKLRARYPDGFVPGGGNRQGDGA